MRILPKLRPAGLAAIAVLQGLATSAGAEANPYYLGVVQSFAHDSNLYRIGGNRNLPTGAQSKADTVSSSSLIAGIDQTWGRQRVSGSASLRADRYADNDHLNNDGYGLKLALDWSTVERISGRVVLTADRSLRSYDPVYQAGLPAERNIEDNNSLYANVRVGVVTRLTGEASLSRRQVRFTAAAYAPSQYDQTIGSLGLRYKASGALTAGLAWRESRVTHPGIDDPSNRRDIDLTGTWDPSGLTNVYARISATRSKYPNAAQRNFSGMTAELRGSTQATGKLRLNAKLSRDLGQSYSTFDFAGLTSATEFDRVGTALRLGADFDLTSKIALNAALEHQRRSFQGTRFTVLDGSDRTNTLELGARWVPTRAIQVGCNLNHSTRSVTVIGNPYSSTGASCYGQFVIQ